MPKPLGYISLCRVLCVREKRWSTTLSRVMQCCKDFPSGAWHGLGGGGCSKSQQQLPLGWPQEAVQEPCRALPVKAELWSQHFIILKCQESKKKPTHCFHSATFTYLWDLSRDCVHSVPFRSFHGQDWPKKFSGRVISEHLSSLDTLLIISFSFWMFKSI